MFKKTFSRPAQSAVLALFLLSPLAYGLGFWLIPKFDAAAGSNLAIDRKQAVTIATEFANSKGIDLTNWSNLCWVKSDNDLHYYQQLSASPERELAKKVLPASYLAVLFRPPDRSETFEVEMTFDGRVLNYSNRGARSAESEDQGEEFAKKLAEEALQKRLAIAGLPFSGELSLEAPPNRAGQRPPPGVQIGGQRPRGVNRRFTWKWPLNSIPELKLESSFMVNGSILVSDRTTAKVEPAFVRANLNPRMWLKIISYVVFGLVIAISVIFGIYRFIQRARQKELSYSRVAILGLAFSVAMGSFVLASDLIMSQAGANPGVPVPDWVILSIFMAFYLIVGMFVGMAYASGEGDIREAYPGKLTSLDALLGGKIFSRNVARSVVAGFAIGGWILFSVHFATLPWAIFPGKGEAPNPLVSVWVGHFPAFAAFSAWPMDVIFVIVVGLLVPLPFFLRRKKLGRARMLFIFLSLWASCAAPYLDFRPWEGTLLSATLRAALVLIAFLGFDLLTAIIAVAAPTFFGFALGMAVQPAASIRQSGLISLSLVAAFLLVQIYFYFKGKVFGEEDVRPVYASLLAERLSMKAEVSAASQAQQRLMPATLPRSDYFSIAAQCLPAHEVGGDFYDLFELEAGKIGLLVAEGGGRGLGSALSIAFAKGFLMPKILGKSDADDSPTEILRGLQSRLAELLDEESAVGLAYLVIDAGDGRLRYARTGTFPAVMVTKADELLKPEETEIRFTVRGTDKKFTVTEGSHDLASGEGVVIYTDGLAKYWEYDEKSPESELARVLKSSSDKGADVLQKALNDSINKCSKLARRQGAEDDLTAVIVRLDKVETI